MTELLSAVSPKANYRVGVTALKERPKLAAMIAEVIALGSSIDHQWTMIMSSLSNADPQAIMAMHSTVSNSTVQRQMLLAVAAIKMKPELLNLFKAIDTVLTPCRRLRNEFAHHLWGDSEELQDALLLIDPTVWVDFDVYLKTPDAAAQSPNAHEKIFVYREKDLGEAVQTMKHGLGLVATFRMLSRWPETLRDIKQKQLESDPLVAKALQSLCRKLRGSSPSGQR
ncbi:MAG: hypothetical protein E5V63_03890 [Mesorhizobium sp.]|nr:MAG: hypothetical protein E5V63_03890 [Mesorhizobium sp.]